MPGDPRPSHLQYYKYFPYCYLAKRIENNPSIITLPTLDAPYSVQDSLQVAALFTRYEVDRTDYPLPCAVSALSVPLAGHCSLPISSHLSRDGS